MSRALPSDSYRGPVFLSDIDETLRCNACRPTHPLPGAARLLHAVRRTGVPIVYLTAAPLSQYRRINAHFLRTHRFPAGPILHRPDGNRDANAVFKTQTIAALRRRLPAATLICLGDNESGDAVAYAGGRCRCAFIRRVRPWAADNLPPGGLRAVRVWSGAGYTPATIRQILRSVSRAIHPRRSPSGLR